MKTENCTKDKDLRIDTMLFAIVAAFALALLLAGFCYGSYLLFSMLPDYGKAIVFLLAAVALISYAKKIVTKEP